MTKRAGMVCVAACVAALVVFVGTDVTMRAAGERLIFDDSFPSV